MSSDQIINNQAPGVEFQGQEAGAIYAEDRLVNGTVYRAQNAEYSALSSQWTLPNGSLSAYAVAQNADGSIGFLSALPPGPFSTWSGNGQRGIYNVRDYGAVGDGVTDDTNAINTATAASQTTGGIVYCPPGTYLISSYIKLYDNTTLQGAGAGATIITAAAQMNGGVQSNALDITMIANSEYNATNPPDQCNIAVKDIQVYGNGPNNYPPPDDPNDVEIKNGLITFKRVYGVRVERCSVQSSSNHGIDIFGSEYYPSPTYSNVWVTDCIIDLFPNQPRPPGNRVSGFPIRLEGLKQCFSIGNKAGFGNVYQGVGQKTNDAMDYVGCSQTVVMSNQMTNCTDGIGTDDGKNVIITDNTMIGCSGFGVGSFASAGHGSRQMVIARNVIDSPGRPAVWLEPPPPDAPSQNVDAVVCDNVIVFSITGQPAILISGPYVICHNNMVDLADSKGTGVTCNATDVVVDNTNVWNGGAGSKGIVVSGGLATPALLLIDNNVEGTTTPLSYVGQRLWKLSSTASIRGNLGNSASGANPPTPSDFAAPAIQMNQPVQNDTPYDCMVYLSGGGTDAVSVSDWMGNLTATGLGGGVAYYVPSGASIEITGSSTPALSWAWVPQ